jgi:hypothetical protein
MFNQGQVGFVYSISKECFYFGETVQMSFNRITNLVVNTQAQVLLKEETTLIGLDENKNEEQFKKVKVVGTWNLNVVTFPNPNFITSCKNFNINYKKK